MTVLSKDDTRKKFIREAGTLTSTRVKDPATRWSMRKEPYVFICHTDADGVKAKVAHPTHWFITKVLGKDAFLDMVDAEWGEDKIVAMLKPAQECTHAIIIISESFPDRKHAVMEMNFFRERYNRERGDHDDETAGTGFKMLPALWGVENAEVFPEEIKNAIWLKSDDADSKEADYLLSHLWPAIAKALGCPKRSRTELRMELARYVEENMGAVTMPRFLQSFWKDNKHLIPSPTVATYIDDDQTLTACEHGETYVRPIEGGQGDIAGDVLSRYLAQVPNRPQMRSYFQPPIGASTPTPGNYVSSMVGTEMCRSSMMTRLPMMRETNDSTLRANTPQGNITATTGGARSFSHGGRSGGENFPEKDTKGSD